jgi:hypothetical protein
VATFIMKAIDVLDFDIIKCGVEFVTGVGARPGVEDLLPHMERNENYVYWMQPKGGAMEQQQACICVNGTYYALNNKLEKAIFRNVRLTRDFKNFERLVDGTRKLVIPQRLFQEKLRTSNRVRAAAVFCFTLSFISLCLLFAVFYLPSFLAWASSEKVSDSQNTISTEYFHNAQKQGEGRQVQPAGSPRRQPLRENASPRHGVRRGRCGRKSARACSRRRQQRCQVRCVQGERQAAAEVEVQPARRLCAGGPKTPQVQSRIKRCFVRVLQRHVR